LAPVTSLALSSGRAQIVAGPVPQSVAPADRSLVSGAIREAFANGFRAAMLVSAFLSLVAAAVAAFGFAGGREPSFESGASSR
ncbi:MAG: hypothetical protein IAI49_14480, partial [Candidatus Eremiobacteraeota bacterium]|nr:hypothetical protein [Candidatus Eremiobacteraeota bacterium]